MLNNNFPYFRWLSYRSQKKPHHIESSFHTSRTYYDNNDHYDKYYNSSTPFVQVG